MPVTSVAGHFLGMSPVTEPTLVKPEGSWYRGDEYVILKQRLEIAEALIAVLEDKAKVKVNRKGKENAKKPESA